MYQSLAQGNVFQLWPKGSGTGAIAISRERTYVKAAER